MKSSNEYITADEMRFLRRELINRYMRVDFSTSGTNLRETVREMEVRFYSMELKRYYYFGYEKS